MDGQPQTSHPSIETGAPVLLREDRGTTAILTLNRPKARNSLSDALLHALGDALDEIGQAAGIHAVVITGMPPAFCAGHDMREMTARRSDADGGRAYFTELM